MNISTNISTDISMKISTIDHRPSRWSSEVGWGGALGWVQFWPTALPIVHLDECGASGLPAPPGRQASVSAPPAGRLLSGSVRAPCGHGPDN